MLMGPRSRLPHEEVGAVQNVAVLGPPVQAAAMLLCVADRLPVHRQDIASWRWLGPGPGHRGECAGAIVAHSVDARISQQVAHQCGKEFTPGTVQVRDHCGVEHHEDAAPDRIRRQPVAQTYDSCGCQSI